MVMPFRELYNSGEVKMYFLPIILTEQVMRILKLIR